MLVPRMNTTARNLISSPTEGLLIYNTQTQQYEYFETIWKAIGGVDGNGLYSGSGSLSGVTTVTQGANTLSFTADPVNAFSVDGTTFSVDASNNRVGIGIAAPLARLHTAGVNAASTSDAFLAEDNVGTDLMVIQNDGNVGIGVVVPLTKLDVLGKIKADKSELTTQSGLATWGYTGHSLSTYGLLQSSAGLTAVNASAAQPISFRIANAVKFEIVGNEFRGNATNGMKISAFSDGGADLYGLGILSNNLQFITPQVGTTFFTWGQGTSAALTEQMRLDEDGNLGISVSVFGTNATKVLAMENGVAPTTSPSNIFQMYANDIVAGNSVPHFRTENGDIVKLFSDGSYVDPTGITDKSTFATSTVTTEDLAEFVKAMYETLKAQGLIKN